MTDDNTVRTSGPEMAAMRKVLARMAGYGENDEVPMNDIILATEAAERFESLAERVAELEELVDPDPGGTEYEQLTKDQKVHRLRKTLAENAATGVGSAMKYREVMMLFDGHPSAGHCYDLMEAAATLDGFVYDKAGNGKGEKRIKVVLDNVNDETLVHAVNKAAQGNPA